MLNVRKIIERIQNKTGMNQTQIALEIFGKSKQGLNNQIRNNTIDFHALVDWGVNEKIDLDWLLTGEGTPGQASKSNGAENVIEYIVPEPEINRLLTLSREILQSKTSYANVLDANIRSFYEAIETQKRFDEIEDELSGVKKAIATMMGGDRRQGERRQNHIDPEIERRSGLERRTGT